MTAISFRGVSVFVDGVRLLHGIDLDVASGEWVGIVGPNGAGKTTLLGTLLGTAPTGGSVSVGGEDVATMSARQRARTVASVPQRPVIPATMRVIDFVLLGRTPHLGYLATEGAGDLDVARTALASLDLLGMADRLLGSLSGGEVQRAVLARALTQVAPVMVLDEPTAALDVGHSQQVLDLVDGVRRSQGLTVMSALHDLTLAAQFCDRLVLVADGELVAEGPPHAVLTESVIRRHYGASVRVIDDGAGGVVVIPIRDSRDRSADARIVGTHE